MHAQLLRNVLNLGEMCRLSRLDIRPSPIATLAERYGFNVQLFSNGF